MAYGQPSELAYCHRASTPGQSDRPSIEDGRCWQTDDDDRRKRGAPVPPIRTGLVVPNLTHGISSSTASLFPDEPLYGMPEDVSVDSRAQNKAAAFLQPQGHITDRLNAKYRQEPPKSFKIGKVFQILWPELTTTYPESALRVPTRVHHTSTPTDSICPGRLNGLPERAFVDTQAENFISESYLKNKGIPWDKNSTHTIKVADGQRYKTLGKVSLPWVFAGESTKHHVDFTVLPSILCHYSVILGGAFMKSIKAFKNWRNWILKVPRKTRWPRVRFQGSGQLRIDGWCDGIHVSASPDCASDVPLISSAFADCLGRPIDTSPECCIDLELPGHRIVMTAGMVRDVLWSFGDQSYYIDFYVLEGLPTKVLLDSQLLDLANVFEDYTELLHEMEEVEQGLHDGLFLLVRRMVISDSQGSSHRFSERLVALFRRQRPSSPQHDTQHDFYAKEKLLIDQQRAVNQSKLSADEKRTETQRIQEQLKLLQLSKPPSGSMGSNPNSHGQSASSVTKTTNSGSQ